MWIFIAFKLPEDESEDQMLALLMQHHIDAEKTGRRTVLPYVSSSRSLLMRLSYLDLTVIRIVSLQRRIKMFPASSVSGITGRTED
ncbi:hypothetical protein KCP73_24860 [Salmonella enterica subsp. enterica]|nr:hypothetical protein KCP73_24860 [Salmonella enterica subsp. enterica]